MEWKWQHSVRPRVSTLGPRSHTGLAAYFWESSDSGMQSRTLSYFCLGPWWCHYSRYGLLRLTYWPYGPSQKKLAAPVLDSRVALPSTVAGGLTWLEFSFLVPWSTSQALGSHSRARGTVPMANREHPHHCSRSALHQKNTRESRWF